MGQPPRITPELVVWSLAIRGGLAVHEIVRRLHAGTSPRTRSVPIVAIAASDMRISSDEILAAGFAGYVRAPFETGQLCALLAEVADAHPRTE